MNRLCLVALMLTALAVAGCGDGHNSTANKDRDRPVAPPAGKK